MLHSVEPQLGLHDNLPIALMLIKGTIRFVLNSPRSLCTKRQKAVVHTCLSATKGTSPATRPLCT